MKLTIIADDNTVGINNEFYLNINLMQLDSSIHAIQWYGEYGEVEYKSLFINNKIVKPTNVLITDISEYQFAIDEWNKAKTLLLETNKALQAKYEAEMQLV